VGVEFVASIPHKAETYKVVNGYRYDYKTVSLLNRVELGPIANAYVEVTPLEGAESGSVIYTGYTSSGDKLETTGLLLLPDLFKQTLSDDSLYLVSATGGEDVDANDDLIRDAVPTANYGTIHAVVTGREIKANGLKLNIMTEIGYQVSKELLDYPEKREEITARLDDSADILFGMDVNGDGVINHADLHAWVPSFDKPKLRVDYNGKIYPIVLKIYNAEDIYDDAQRLVYPTVPPVADAGTDQSISFGESVTLDGSKSYDRDGYIVEYLWREGDTVYCSGAESECVVDELTAGTHLFKLVVQDNDGTVNIDSVQVTVKSEAFVVGALMTPGPAMDVAISADGNVAYVVDFYYGLRIIDVSKPATPILIGGFDTPGYPYAVTLSEDGTIAYVADSFSGLQIIDITNTVSPSLIGSYDTPGSARDVALSKDGTTAYVTDYYSGLQIINITNPASPFLIASYDTPGYADKIALSEEGTIVYIADQKRGLQIINVSNPGMPYIMSNYDTSGYAQSITLSLDGTAAYIADGDYGVQIIDISNPEAPLFIGEYAIFGYARSVVLSLDGTVAYVSNGEYGLQIIDISNPSAGSLIGSYDTRGSALAVTISADGNIAYVADLFSGLQIIDISAFAR
jgi:hypothetical protein